jgi:5-methylcytosine-specific restriction endonuclease McrA
LTRYCENRSSGIRFDHNEPEYLGRKDWDWFDGRGSVAREFYHLNSNVCSDQDWTLESQEWRSRTAENMAMLDSGHRRDVMSGLRSLDILKHSERMLREQSEDASIASRIASNNQRTKLKGLDYCYSVKDWDKTVAVFGNRCVYCNKRTSSIEIEHFVPVCKGGGTSIGNIVPACKTCNQLKGCSGPEAYLSPDKYRDILRKLERLAAAQVDE